MSTQFTPLNKNQRKLMDGARKSDIEVINYNSFNNSISNSSSADQERVRRSASVNPPVTVALSTSSQLDKQFESREPLESEVNVDGGQQMNSKGRLNGSTCQSRSSMSINSPAEKKDLPSNRLLYKIDDKPNVYISILLGLQHYITMLGGTITYPYILTSKLCMKESDPARGYVIATTLFCSGFASLMQTYLGIRLPIIQGATFTFLVPTLAILTLPQWQCPSDKQIIASRLANSSFISSPSVTGQEYSEVWMSRMREIQGAIILSSLVETFIGFTGILGYILRFITPLSIVPTISLIGLSLFKEATAPAGESWIVACITIALVIIFSQYLTAYKVPLFLYSSQHKKFYIKRVKVFELFPILLTITFAWLTCWLLTVTDVYPKNHPARTDGIMNRLIHESPWIRVPYPFQWGLPTVTLSAVLGMTAGVIASAIESIGDYYAAARLSSVASPPSHAINRGIFMEGVGCIFSGIMGSGGGLTSYSENVGAIGITRIASRQIIASASIIMIIMSIFTKFSAIFATVPIPIIGGLLMTMFSMCTAVGLSTLQFVDLNSSRNLVVLGSSLFLGLSIPKWILDHPESIRTMSPAVDQVIFVLMSTSMFVGGVVAIILDNTIPGTDEERGVLKWLHNNAQKMTGHNIDSSDSGCDSGGACYDLPAKINNYIMAVRWLQYIPISPSYTESNLREKMQHLTHKFTSKIVMHETNDTDNVHGANDLDDHCPPVGITIDSSGTNMKNTLNKGTILPRQDNKVPPGSPCSSSTGSSNGGTSDKSNALDETHANKFANFSMSNFFSAKDRKKSKSPEDSASAGDARYTLTEPSSKVKPMQC